MEILHNTHQLDDSADKILINLRLKDKALKCFQSKPSHFGMSATELLEAMKGMCDHRTWTTNETFCDYYIEKLTLENRINVDSEELIDVLIDGIPNTRLRDQARMNYYENAEELLRAFKKIELEENVGADRRRSTTPRQPTRDETTNKELRCYNCNTTDHIKKNCPKSLKTWGSCCGRSLLRQHRASCNQLYFSLNFVQNSENIRGNHYTSYSTKLTPRRVYGTGIIGN